MANATGTLTVCGKGSSTANSIPGVGAFVYPINKQVMSGDALPTALTGHWVLDHERTPCQKDFMKSLGRPSWQISVVNGADETFFLMHFARRTKPGVAVPWLHLFDKRVDLCLNSTILRAISRVWEVDRVSYRHALTANGAEVHHADDEKRFGPCTSRCSWEPADNDRRVPGGTSGTMVLRWYLRNGLLVVRHTLNMAGSGVPADDTLHVKMTFTSAADQSQTSVDKFYTRHPFTKDQLGFINAHALRESLLPT